MECTRQIGRYTVYAKVGVVRRQSPTATYVSQAREMHHRALKALMDEVDRAPAKIIDQFLSHWITMIWDLPGGEAKWGYLQGTLTRATGMIKQLKGNQILNADALECGAIVIGCGLDETRNWSNLKVKVDDPKYVTTQQWSAWEGGFLPWLMKWRIRGEFPDYSVDGRDGEVNLSRRIQEIKSLLLPSIERQLGEELTAQLWAYAMGIDGVTQLGRLMRLEVTERPGDRVLSRLLQLVQAGELVPNQNPGQIFIREKRTYFVHPRCLNQLRWEEGMGDAKHLYALLRDSQLASEAAEMRVMPREGRAIKLWCFSVGNDELRRQAERLNMIGTLDLTSPWLQFPLPFFDGTVEEGIA